MTRAQLEKTFDNFFAQFNGYGLDFDHAYGNQCFDLVQELNVNWYGGRFLPGQYAYQLANANPDQYLWIPNSATASPIKGDIPVWDNNYNHAGGHTGAATGKGVTQGKPTDWFEAFVQNDPTGSVCHLKNYSYDHVIGWLRFKTTEPPVPPNTDETGKKVEYDKIVLHLFNKKLIDSSDSRKYMNTTIISDIVKSKI